MKIENLAEKKPSLTTVSLSVRGCTSLAAMLIFLLPGVSMETVEFRESAVCMIIVDYDGKSQRLCRQIGSDPLPPAILRYLGADLPSDSATCGRSLELQTDRRSNVFSLLVVVGGGAVKEAQAGLVSLGSRVLVLLVYGGFVLQQSQAQVTAPAPCETDKHSENHEYATTSSA